MKLSIILLTLIFMSVTTQSAHQAKINGVWGELYLDRWLFGLPNVTFVPTDNNHRTLNFSGFGFPSGVLKRKYASLISNGIKKTVLLGKMEISLESQLRYVSSRTPVQATFHYYQNGFIETQGEQWSEEEGQWLSNSSLVPLEELTFTSPQLYSRPLSGSYVLISSAWQESPRITLLGKTPNGQFSFCFYRDFKNFAQGEILNLPLYITEARKIGELTALPTNYYGPEPSLKLRDSLSPLIKIDLKNPASDKTLLKLLRKSQPAAITPFPPSLGIRVLECVIQLAENAGPTRIRHR